MRVLPANLAHYPPGTLLPSLDPPVIIVQRAYSSEFCDLMTAEMLTASKGASSVHGYDLEGASRFRTSSYCSVPESVFARAKQALLEQVHKALPTRWQLAESLQMLRYDAHNNGMFKAHTDNAYFDASGAFQYSSPHRIMSTLSYMNENFDGGQLIVNSVLRDEDGKPLTIQPTKGMLVIFPSDVRFMHEVLPVTRGTRCSVVGWLKPE